MKNKIKKLNQTNVRRFKIGNFFLVLAGILMGWSMLSHFILRGKSIDTYHGSVFAEISFWIAMMFFFLIIYDIIHLMCLDVQIESVSVTGVATPGSDVDEYLKHLNKLSGQNSVEDSTNKEENKNSG